jgi:uncharacterized protein (TIGR03435 family)
MRGAVFRSRAHGAALEEQLGLKLNAQRVKIPILVIDSVDRPIEN